MARALVKINGTDSQFTTVAIGSTVSLSNHDEGGELAYLWAIADQPAGTADVLSATGVENVSFVPTKEGSYELRLVVNATLATQAIQTAIVAVLDARTNERIPAATETTETGAAKGWALSASRILSRTLHASVDGNLVIAQTPGGLAAGAIVILTGIATINAGTQAVFTVPRLAAALGTVGHRERLGVVIDGVAPGDLSALVQVRMFGLVPFNGTGSPAVGALVFLSDTGQAALTAGTVPRQIGYVAAASGGSYQWVINAGMQIPVTNADLAQMAANTIKGNNTGGTANAVDLTAAQVRALVGKIYLGTQILTGSGTYTPTAGTMRVRVRMVAAGGGSGGGGTSANACPGGGGPGTYFEKFIDPSATITGGAFSAPTTGGAGGANTGANGTTGSDATIVIQGTTYTAKGGPGGSGSTGGAVALATSVVGGSSAGDVVRQGVGQHGWFVSGVVGIAGLGGSTPFGDGGRGRSTGDAGAGANGSGFGSGGGGASGINVGGNGAGAIIFVDEWS